MRPIHVVVLLLGGALGGALIMKLVHPGQPLIPVADAVEVQPVIATAPEQPLPVKPPLGQPGADQPSADQPGIAQTQPVAQMKPAVPQPGGAPPIVAAARKPPPDKPPATHEVPKPQPAPPILAVILHPSAPPPQIAEPAPVPQPAPIIAPPPASPEPEQLTPAAPQISAAPVPQPHQVTLNAGLILPVRLVDGLSSERNAPGDTFAATLDKEVVADGFVIAERGARVEGKVVAVERAKVRSSAALALELTTLHTSDGQTVAIQTDGYFKHADPPQVNNTTKIAGGAIIGAAIGALAGGGKGAAIGAGVGGGAGAGDVLLTHRPLEMPSESLVTFRLKSPVPLTEQLR